MYYSLYRQILESGYPTMIQLTRKIFSVLRPLRSSGAAVNLQRVAKCFPVILSNASCPWVWSRTAIIPATYLAPQGAVENPICRNVSFSSPPPSPILPLCVPMVTNPGQVRVAHLEKHTEHTPGFVCKWRNRIEWAV